MRILFLLSLLFFLRPIGVLASDLHARLASDDSAADSLGADDSARAAEAVESMALSVGRTMFWPVPASGSISVSNGAIVRVADQGRLLKITGLKLGAATIRSGFRTLEINVIPEAAYRIFARVKKTLENRRGLTLSSSSGALHITGRLLRADDLFALGSSGASPGALTFSAAVEPEIEDAVRAGLGARLRAAGLNDVNFRFTPDVVATVGLEPRDAKDRAEKVLAPLGIRVESNSSVLALEPLIRVKILVAEVKKSFYRQFGVKWPTSVGGSLLPDLTFALDAARFDLSLFEQNGWGRVLASPNLLCRSGKEAEFMAGGEFPIKLSSFKSSGVIWKNYGVLLRVKPVADQNGRMSIAIETEVSELDQAHSVDGVPGLFTNRMQTHFDLTRSRTIALSGLIKSQSSRSSAGLPALGSIPILGPLFSSKDFRDERSELMIFVTPEVVKADDPEPESHP